MTSFCKYKVYADIRGGSSGRERQTTVPLSSMEICGDLYGYFFGNFIEIRPAILYCDMLPFVGLKLIYKMNYLQ